MKQRLYIAPFLRYYYFYSVRDCLWPSDLSDLPTKFSQLKKSPETVRCILIDNQTILFWFTTLYIYNSLSLSLPA